MAVKFYLNEINDQHEIFCNTNSSFTEIAGSFDIGTLELEWNTNKHAIFPYTKLFIVDTETNNKWKFVISQDNVSVVNKEGVTKYIHNLIVSQNTHILNNHLLRNTHFQQPFDYEKHFQKNTLFYNMSNWENGGLQEYDYHSGFFNNDDNFLKSLYTIDFSDTRRKLKNAYFIVNQRSTWYKDSVLSNLGGTNVKLEQSNPQSYRSDTITSIYMSLVNYDDPTDYINLQPISSIPEVNNFNKKVYLTDEQINWINGKKIYLKISSAFTKDMSDVLQFQRETSAIFPQVFGIIYCDFYFESYYYSLWDVLKTIQLQEVQQYNNDSRDFLFLLPDKNDSEDGKLLNSIIAPEFNFTNVDVYTAIAQVLSYIDAFPLLDENNILHFEYLNDLSQDKIVDLEENDTKISLNEQNFSNRLITNYQNGRTENSISCPGKNNFKYLGANNFGIVDKNDYWFILDTKIDYIEKLNIYLNTISQNIGGYYLYLSTPIVPGYDYQCVFEDFPIGLETLDISTVVFEKEIYEQLPEGFATNNFPNKNNTLYYTKGDNKIYAGILGNIVGVGEAEVLYYAIAFAFSRYLGINYSSFNVPITGTDTNTLRQTLRFNCLYHSIFDGRVAQESTINKIEGETFVAQENSAVDLNRMGNNLQGLIAKLGTEQKTVNLPITEFKDKYKLGTYWEDGEGGKWFINQIKTTFTTNENKVVVDGTFTKNFNMLSQFTKINQEKRFYDISTKLTTTGYENINEFIYFTNRNIDVEPLTEDISLYKSVVAAMFYNNPTYKINIATLETKNHINSSNTIKTYIPLHSYGNGNQICFEIGFDSPINAGNHIVNNDGSYINKTALYTESMGFADIVNIEMYDSSYVKQFDRDFPFISNSDLSEMFKCLNINQFYYYKKQSEIFHLNYAINFMPYFTKNVDTLGTPIYKYDEIYFGDKFINNNNILQNIDNITEFYIYGSTEKFSMLDNKLRSTDVNLGQCNLIVTYYGTDSDWGSYGDITPKINNNTVNISEYEGWCIADKEGNILISVNNIEGAYSYAKLLYFTSRYRKI